MKRSLWLIAIPLALLVCAVEIWRSVRLCGPAAPQPACAECQTPRLPDMAVRFIHCEPPTKLVERTVNGAPETLFCEDESGQQHGLYIDFWSADKIKAKGTFVDGKESGAFVRYYENGIKESDAIYQDGKLNGHYLEYWPNGNKKQEGDYVNGQREKSWVTFYENGPIELEGQYRADRPIGHALIRYETGEKKIEQNYDDSGNLTGKWVSYGHDGKKQIEGSYLNGLRQGVWIEFDADEKPLKRIKYADDTPVTADGPGTE